jgi:hypothetical protein
MVQRQANPELVILAEAAKIASPQSASRSKAPSTVRAGLA